MKPKKLYIVRKYVVATSVRQAMEIERTKPADEIHLDDNYKHVEINQHKIGFSPR